jgi:hypothetical protein
MVKILTQDALVIGPFSNYWLSFTQTLCILCIFFVSLAILASLTFRIFIIATDVSVSK